MQLIASTGFYGRTSKKAILLLETFTALGCPIRRLFCQGGLVSWWKNYYCLNQVSERVFLCRENFGCAKLKASPPTDGIWQGDSFIWASCTKHGCVIPARPLKVSHWPDTSCRQVCLPLAPSFRPCEKIVECKPFSLWMEGFDQGK